MSKAWMTALGGLLALAGCGTLLDIRPDSDSVPPTGDGGSIGDARADDAEASSVVPNDGAIVGQPCPSSGPCVLAKDLQDLGSIAVAGGNVYFTRHQTAGAILQVPTDGGPVTTLVSSSNLPASLYATPEALFWITEGDNGLARHTFGGLTSTSSNGAITPTAQIVAIGAETFWTIPGSGASDGQVRTSAVFSPGLQIGPSTTFPNALAVDSMYVYFAAKIPTGHIVRLGHTGTPVNSTGAPFNSVGAIALSSHGIAAATASDAVYRVVTTGDTDFVNPWVRVSKTPNAAALVADDAAGTLYVLAADGTLEVILDDSASSLTKRNTAGCSAGRALAQDATHVYLACQDSIVRLPK